MIYLPSKALLFMLFTFNFEIKFGIAVDALVRAADASFAKLA